ncbi:MAG: AAA family ATPase [Anaerolineales bacterium]
MTKLRRVILNGFKSIKTMDIELRDLNVLIGANGAGKSNLVSFFKMLNEMMGGQMGGRLQEYIGASGYAQSILHFGPKITPQMDAQLEFEVDNAIDIYSMRLFHAGDTLLFADEKLEYQQQGFPMPKIISLGAGHKETKIREAADAGDKVARVAQVFRHLLTHCRVYHFHDTSPTARVRLHSYIGDNRFLMSDAGNLAALLYRLQNENNGLTYRQIVSTIRLIAPFFDDFEIKPTGPQKQDVKLEWRHKGSDQVFGPHQLSDGTLRAICLITLLMQPELPDLIVVDEPELGLHPYALNIIAALFRKASLDTQVLITTQSSAFLNNFDLEDVIVANRVDMETQFTRLDATDWDAWLEEYSLGEVWEKNVIGGGPH